MGYIHSVNINDKIINVIAFDASLLLNFSQPKSTPPNTIPTKAKETNHKKYINPIDIALLGSKKNNVTLSALPPIIQLAIPKHKVTAPTIKDGFKLNNLISWLILSKKLLIRLIIFKKITSQ